jgi:hypothetical protein
MTTPEHDFVNKLRVMYSLDSWELDGMSEYMIKNFLMDPFRTMMKLDEKNLAIVWKAIEKRCTS